MDTYFYYVFNNSTPIEVLFRCIECFSIFLKLRIHKYVMVTPYMCDFESFPFVVVIAVCNQLGGRHVSWLCRALLALDNAQRSERF
jgi:hypothetical protein